LRLISIVLVVGVVEVMVLNEVMAMGGNGNGSDRSDWRNVGSTGNDAEVMIPEVMVMTLALVGLIERMLDL